MTASPLLQDGSNSRLPTSPRRPRKALGRVAGERVEERREARALEADLVDGAEQRELPLEAVRPDDRHELFTRHRTLQLLAVEQLGLDLGPAALAPRAGEGLGALA